jgi:hypothetical protein
VEVVVVSAGSDRTRGAWAWRATLVVAVAIVAGGCSTLGRYVPAGGGTVERRIVFPVAGRVSYVDTFGAPRSGGRTHQGEDLMSAKHTPVVAVVDGTVSRLTWSLAGLSGNSLTITDAAGWTYVYIHLNNDAPGTDDASNVYERAFADGIAKGQRVRAGEIVGFVGDSGNAENAGSHLHFELHRPDGTAVNPYGSLRAAPSLVRSEAQRAADSPVGRLENVARAADGSVRVAGFAIDAHAPTAVRISVYVGGNPVASGTAGASRPDLAASFPGRGTRHGFLITGVRASAGSQVCAIAASVGGGGSTRLGCVAAPA